MLLKNATNCRCENTMQKKCESQMQEKCRCESAVRSVSHALFFTRLSYFFSKIMFVQFVPAPICFFFALSLLFFRFFCIIPRFGVHFIACFLHFPCLLMSERRRQNTERKHSAFELMHRRSLHTQQSHFGKPLLRWKVL